MSFEFSVTPVGEVDAQAVIEGRRTVDEVLDAAFPASTGINTSFSVAGVVIDVLEALPVEPGDDIECASDLFAGGRTMERGYVGGDVQLLDPRRVRALAAALAPLDPDSASGLVDAAVQRVLTPRERGDAQDPLGLLAEELAELAEFVRAGARDGVWLMTTANG